MTIDKREILPEDMLPPDPEAGKKQQDEEADHAAQESARVEREAAAMGWSPKENWRGASDKWMPAEKFLERGKTLIPILSERLEKQTSKIADLESTLKDLGEHHRKTLQAERERNVRDLQAARKKAFEEHDGEAFEEADRKLAEARGNAKETGSGAGDNGKGKGELIFTTDDVKDWKGSNAWYDTDTELQACADSQAHFVAKVKPNLRGKEFLEEVSKNVQRQFPEKFENPNRRRQTTVGDGTHEFRGKDKGKNTYVDLPAKAKSACDKFVKQGLMSRDEYCRDFYSQGTRFELDGDIPEKQDDLR